MAWTKRFAACGLLASIFSLPACAGDGGSSSSFPPGVPSVVFDIDGTLTPTPVNLFGVRLDAARAVRAYVDKGYAVIYATARPLLFEDYTGNWLATNGFPDLPLHMATLEQSGDPIPYTRPPTSPPTPRSGFRQPRPGRCCVAARASASPATTRRASPATPSTSPTSRPSRTSSSQGEVRGPWPSAGIPRKRAGDGGWNPRRYDHRPLGRRRAGPPRPRLRALRGRPARNRAGS